MADQGRWFKLWVSAPTDPDLANLSLEDFGRWCLFGAYLKLHGEDGRLTIKGPGQALQNLFRVPSFEAVVKVLRSFPNCQLSGPGVTSLTSLQGDAIVRVEWSNWQKYQIDDSSYRVRKWREKQRGLVTVDSVSPVTPIEERRREEKRREEKKQGTSSSRVVLSDDQFLDSLRSNPAYQGLDIDREMGKLDAWLLTPRGRGKQKTRQRVVNWLNGADKPMAAWPQADPYAKFPRT